MKFDGKKLREKREQYGLSLQALADMCQCTKSYIHDLEKDKGIEPSGAKVFLFSRSLGVPMDCFYGAESHEDIRQAIAKLAHGCASVIGVDAYFDICRTIYPGWNPQQNHPTREDLEEFHRTMIAPYVNGEKK